MVFSISIGDAVALAQLVVKVGEAVGSGITARIEYRRIMHELDTFQNLINIVATICITSHSLEAQRVLELINDEVKACNEAMAQFIARNPSPDRIIRRILWIFQAPGRAAALREQISSYRGTLSLLLNHFYHLTHKNQIAQLSSLSFRLPVITIVDAVGDEIPIPIFLCHTYDILLDTLYIYYKHRPSLPGRDFVLRRDFDLVYGDAKKAVESGQWSSILSVSRMEMSMILRRHGIAQDACPWCGFQSVNGLDEWSLCLRCNKCFQIKRQIEYVDEYRLERDVEETDASSSTRTLGVERSSNTLRFQRDTDLVQVSQPDWTDFRLLSILIQSSTHVPMEGGVEADEISYLESVDADGAEHARLLEDVLGMNSSTGNLSNDEFFSPFSTLPPSIMEPQEYSSSSSAPRNRFRRIRLTRLFTVIAGGTPTSPKETSGALQKRTGNRLDQRLGQFLVSYGARMKRYDRDMYRPSF